MTTVIGSIYSSRNFTYNPAIKCFIGDISEVPEVLRQLWSTEFESGFGIRSAKTNRVVYFVLEKVMRNDDNEIVSWVFAAVNDNDHEELRGVKAFIYND